MKRTHKLKYINLFEELSQSEIPYSEFDDNGKLNIRFPKSVTSVPPVFNELTTEVTGWIEIYNTLLQSVTVFDQLQSVGDTLSIYNNTALETVTEFNQLQSVGGSLWIYGNTVLETVTGFESLQSVGVDLSINDNPVLETVTGFNQLHSVGISLWIKGNTVLQSVTGFEQLQSIGWNLRIYDNPQLTQVTGFNQLQSVGMSLFINNNPNLVTLSTPSTLIRSVNYKKYYYIEFEKKHRFESPDEFVNSDDVIQDCIDKFNPGLHGNIVVKQIMGNLELWGTPATKATIVNHLLSKGNYLEHIPNKMKHLIEDTYKYLYAKEHKNTGAKSVAKVATGITYGLF